MTLGLELGGKDPAYVLPDAKMDHAVANLVDGAFYNSGQCCCGIERVYVHEKVYDEFVDGFVAETKDYVVGNPLEPATTMGPMAQARFADLIREQKAEALRKGAKAHINMKVERDRRARPTCAPEVLTNVDHQMSVMREESFGPIVGIMKVRNDEEAIALMNDSPYGLTASIWTAIRSMPRAIGDRIETGTVFMNRCDYLDPALVWTGVKDTGKGAALSAIGYDNLTRPKSYHLRESDLRDDIDRPASTGGECADTETVRLPPRRRPRRHRRLARSSLMIGLCLTPLRALSSLASSCGSEKAAVSDRWPKGVCDRRDGFCNFAIILVLPIDPARAAVQQAKTFPAAITSSEARASAWCSSSAI